MWSAVVGAVVSLVQFFFRNRWSMRKAVHAVHEVYRTLNDAMAKFHADRVLLLASENGGGIPRPGRMLYSSILYEVNSGGSPSMFVEWQKQQLDEAYIAMLCDVYTSGIILIHTHEMPPGSHLRSLSETHGIKATLVFIVREERNRVIYAALTFTDEETIRQTDPALPFVHESVRGLMNALNQQIARP